MESAEDWVSVGFTALPSGWVHEDADKYESPCPGVLIQELRGHWNAGEYQLAEEPYETRVILARHDPVDNTLVPATDVLRTWAPKDPRR